MDEELNSMQEVYNIYNEFAISIVQYGLIVRHVLKQISKYFCKLLKSGEFINVKDIGTPANTKKCGIHVPCMYFVNGQKPFE